MKKPFAIRAAELVTAGKARNFYEACSILGKLPKRHRAVKKPTPALPQKYWWQD